MSGGSTPQRTKSCDANEVNNRLSHISDEGQSGISTVAEHENHEDRAWSSDYSNSEDEFTSHEDEVLPVGSLFSFFCHWIFEIKNLFALITIGNSICITGRLLWRWSFRSVNERR